MFAEGMDPSLVSDFLTESGELIEQLDADLVRLESEPASQALLDQIFRALHTIKGAASFLGLPNLTTFAHAAEDALNKLRKGEARVGASVIDAMLRSVDVLRGMLGEVRDGTAVTPGPQELIDRLHEVGAEGGGSPKPAAAGVTQGVVKPAGGNGGGVGGGGGGVIRRALSLGSEKVDLLPFMGDELRVAAEEFGQYAELLEGGSAAAEVAERLRQTMAGLAPTVEFFSLEGLTGLAAAVGRLSDVVAEADKSLLDAAADRIRTAGVWLNSFGEGLKAGEEIVWTAAELEQKLLVLAVSPEVTERVGFVVRSGAEEEGVATASVETGIAESSEAGESSGVRAAAKPEAKAEAGGGGADQTVRVEVSRLEALLNLVGEMVLTKNQILGLARQLRGYSLPHEVQETVAGAVGNLDRLTSELQVGVMRTRMQPLGKLFGRYPRIVRDLARATGKQINIEITGNETEVDKSVLEALSDPMVHILRNSADHGIEKSEVRVAAGKPATGLIRLIAEHQGGHVRVAVIDDGKGVDSEVVGRKAVEKGLVTAEQLGQMSQQEIINLLFVAGFSMAEKVSDLSGRGVGMDVVRTNITKLGGTINLTSTKGKGTMIEVLIPLTVAIMPAMLVGIGPAEYAIPLACVVEIVRIDPEKTHSVAGKPVIRLRESVLPLVDMNDRLGEEKRPGSRRFAVVVEVGQQRAGLVVDHLVGQQEVVIKPLDDKYTTGGPFSGATIRENGDVSLIIDAVQLIRSVQGAESASA